MDDARARFRRHWEAARTFGRRTIAEAHAAGMALIEVKAATPHGEWTQWLDSEEVSTSTASRLMQLGRLETSQVGKFDSVAGALKALPSPSSATAEARPQPQPQPRRNRAEERAEAQADAIFALERENQDLRDREGERASVETLLADLETKMDAAQFAEFNRMREGTANDQSLAVRLYAPPRGSGANNQGPPRTPQAVGGGLMAPATAARATGSVACSHDAPGVSRLGREGVTHAVP